MSGPAAKHKLDGNDDLHQNHTLPEVTENAGIIKMDTGSDDVEMANPGAGRRLRPRPTQINSYEECVVGEEDGKACRSKQAKNRGHKRKAEVNIESLYRQENMKEVPSTPLETIFELPRPGPGCGVRGKRREEETGEGNEDGMTSLNDMCDLSLSVMAKRKIKRLCLFNSHYYPSKQKTRRRKERARLMKEHRGVNVPDGEAISIEDVEAVLSCLSGDEDQNENNQNVMNNSSLIVNKSGFYSGNVIRADIDDRAVDDMIHNMETLEMNNTSQGNIGNSSLPMFMDELIPSLPFTDEPLEFCSNNSREKKVRRRSGKLTVCPLPPVPKMSGSTSSRGHQISEQSCAFMQPVIVDNPFVVSTLSTEEESQNSFERDKIPKSPKYIEEFSCIPHLEQIKPSVNKILKVNQRRKSVKERKTKDKDISNEIDDEPRTVTENMAGGKKENAVGIRRKRPSKSAGERGMKKRKDFKSDNNTEDICVEESGGQLEKVIETTGTCLMLRNKKGKKRRISGVQRPLYSTVVELPNPDTSENDDSKTSLIELKDAVENPINATEENALSRPFTVVTQESTLSCPSATVGTTDNTVSHPSPTSPSSQMAALNLHTDKSPAACRNTCQSPLTRVKKKEDRRRSARLSTGPAVKERFLDRMCLGSYWSSFSPSCSTTKNVGTYAVEGRCTSTQPLDLPVYELQLTERSNTESVQGRRGKEMISKDEGRRRSGLVSRQDLIAVAEEESKALDTVNAENVTAGLTLAGNPRWHFESDDITQKAQSSQTQIKDHSVCTVTECLSHQSHLLPHTATKTTLPLQGTCVKTHEMNVTNRPRQNLLGLDNKQQDAIVTIFTTKKLHNVNRKTQNINVKDCATRNVNISQDSKQAIKGHGIPSHSSLFGNPSRDLETPRISDHVVRVTHSVEQNGPPGVHSVGNNSMPVMSTLSGSQSKSVVTITTVTCKSRECSAHLTSGSKSGGCHVETYGNDNMALNSPIISGMFENNAAVRLGKIYHNKDALSSSLVTHGQLCRSQFQGSRSLQS